METSLCLALPLLQHREHSYSIIITLVACIARLSEGGAERGVGNARRGFGHGVEVATAFSGKSYMEFIQIAVRGQSDATGRTEGIMAD